MSKTQIKHKIISTIAKRFFIAIIVVAFSATGMAQSLCGPSFTYTVGSGGQVSFTGSSVGTTTNCVYTWNWWGNSGYGTSNQQSPTITFPYNGTYIVGLSISDSTTGCSGSVSDSIIISNGQPCQASFTYTVGANGLVSFSNTSVGSTTYFWNFGDNTSSNISSPTHTYMYNGTYQVYLYGDTTGAGCGASTSTSITITTGIPCNIHAGFTYAAGANGLINFTNTSTGTNAATVYSWDFGDYNYSSLQSPSNTYAYNGIYRVHLSVSDSNGVCSSQVTDSVIVTNATPTPTCTASFTYTIGANGLVNFTSTSAGSLPHTSWGWNFGDGNYSYFSPTASNTYLYNGTYNVTFSMYDSLNNAYSCSTTQMITITNASPNTGCTDSAYFYMYPDTSAPHTWNLYLANGNLNGNALSAVWQWGDGSSTGGLYPSHTYAAAGWYNICVSVYYACGDSSHYCAYDSLNRSSSSMITVNVINSSTGIKSMKNNMAGVKLYPNPFNDNLTLEVNSANSTSFTYAMMDAYGKQILNEKVSVSVGENKVEINTGSISGGVYFVTLVDDATKMSQTIKVVK